MASDSKDPAEIMYSLSDLEERRVLYAALDSFRQYRWAAHYNITHLRRQSFYSLPSTHLDLLSGPPFSLPRTFDAVDRAIDANADVADAILQFGLEHHEIDPNNDAWKGQAMTNDMDKARITIKQLYRDWSAEAQSERNASHGPILKALETYYGARAPSERVFTKVLVPGSGLGRLMLDICADGYSVEGNEISHHQLLASMYILHCTKQAGQHKLFPWALNFSNHRTRAHQLRAVPMPDVCPAGILEDSSMYWGLKEGNTLKRMGITTGDFSVIYRQSEQREQFDAVATCFFIDTAPNVINYIETIRHCLKKDGIWINIGPLLWHFESTPTPAEKDRKRQMGKHRSATDGPGRAFSGNDNDHAESQGIGDPGSFELSKDEILELVKHLGFEILELKDAPGGVQGYLQDTSSMYQNIYVPVFWVAKKL